MLHALEPLWRDLPGRLLAALALAMLAAAPTAARAADKGSHQAAPPAADSGMPAPGNLPPPPLASGKSNDPIVASVEGHLILLSDVGRAAKALPANLQNMPFETLFPVLLDRLVDHEALVMLAERRDLEDTPEVRQQIEDARNRIMEAALLAKDAAPKVTEDAIKARYDRLYANRPATEQVRASHILVGSKEAALKLIADLKQGADFATLAEKYSTDPDGKKGGELGFFSREQVWPGFADVAFSLEPGQVADQPVHNEFGWHVIKVEERRLVAPPSFSDMHDKIKNELLQEAIGAEVASARSQLTIHEWNLDGSEMNPAMHVDTVTAKAKP
ncbi:MAG TPA: peptidylprolyl isomerase [Acetobacteraceae bacterium]|nr:peptidylprolyl isomerase [Acetobacteraceae bacterium]